MKAFKKKQDFFPFGRLLRFLIGLAISIQVIVITYNHFSGYFVLNGFQHFLMRLLRGSLLSLIAGFMIALPDLFIINYLNKIAIWGKKTFKRILIQLGFAVSIAVVISTLITLFAN